MQIVFIYNPLLLYLQGLGRTGKRPCQMKSDFCKRKLHHLKRKPGSDLKMEDARCRCNGTVLHSQHRHHLVPLQLIILTSHRYNEQWRDASQPVTMLSSLPPQTRHLFYKPSSKDIQTHCQTNRVSCSNTMPQCCISCCTVRKNHFWSTQAVCLYCGSAFYWS